MLCIYVLRSQKGIARYHLVTSYYDCFEKVLGKDLSIYGHANIFDHELLLLTIIYMISELGGETLSPYLSLCLMDAICSKNML